MFNDIETCYWVKAYKNNLQLKTSMASYTMRDYLCCQLKQNTINWCQHIYKRVYERT